MPHPHASKMWYINLLIYVISGILHIIYSQTIALHKNKLIFITFIGNQFVMQCTLFYIPACIYNNKFTCKKVNTCTRLPVYIIIY